MVLRRIGTLCTGQNSVTGAMHRRRVVLLRAELGLLAGGLRRGLGQRILRQYRGQALEQARFVGIAQGKLYLPARDRQPHIGLAAAAQPKPTVRASR